MDAKESTGFFIMTINISITADQVNERLDSVISYTIPSCSRSTANKMITSGLVTVNQVGKKPGYKVKCNDQISIRLQDHIENERVTSQKMPIDIQYEDEHIIVINKPAGLVVHPAPGHLSGTLVNGLLHHDANIINTTDDVHRSGIVHRLDKDTSGIMVVARTRNAFEFLQKEFKQRRVIKKYLALVHGSPEETSGSIDYPIGRHPVKRKLMSVMEEGGKPALTLWKIRERFKTVSLVDINLKTGRTHQIRVHFYAKGYPLVGDPVYQYKRYRKSKSMIASRQMLHSYFLSFRHPYTGRRVDFSTDLPEDFSSLLLKFK